MNVKLDENLSRHLKEPLARLGHRASTCAEEGLLGRSDVQVGDTAGSAGMIVFTLDLEFADLRKHPPGGHPGIVLFRPPNLGPTAVNRFILGFVRSTPLEGLASCVVVVEPGRMRIRRPPADPGTR